MHDLRSYSVLLSLTQGVVEYLVALKDSDYSFSIGCKLPIKQEVETSRRPNECCQRPKTSFDFFFPFAFQSGHQFGIFFALIMLFIDSLWLFKFGSPQKSCILCNHKPQCFDFLIECKPNNNSSKWWISKVFQYTCTKFYMYMCSFLCIFDTFSIFDGNQSGKLLDNESKSFWFLKSKLVLRLQIFWPEFFYWKTW